MSELKPTSHTHDTDAAIRQADQANAVEGRDANIEDLADQEPDLGQQFLKLLVEMGPLVVFFTVNAYFGLFNGTAAFMVAIVISLIASKLIFGHIPVMPLVTAAFVLVLGGFTIWLQDEVFIKIKPTIVNSFFAIALAGGILSGRILLKYVFGEVFNLKEEGWHKLTWRWIGFFVFLALLNEFIWRTQTTDFWVSFKVFGIMPLTLVFGAAQIGLLKKYEIKSK